jgi:hypothetical protein
MREGKQVGYRFRDRPGKHKPKIGKLSSFDAPSSGAYKNSIPVEAIDDLDVKVKQLFESQELLFDRVKPRQKSELFSAARSTVNALRAKLPKDINSKLVASSSKNLRRLSVKKVTIPVIAAGILLVYLGLVSQKKPTTTTGVVDAKPGVTVVAGDKIKDLDLPFKLLIPISKTIDLLGGISKVSPDGSAPAYAYIDVIDGIKINVTQQELPLAVKNDPLGGLEKVAKDFQASNIIQIDDVKVYHGLNEKTGYQSIIASKKQVLVLIRAEQKLDDTQIATYILNLQ